jgi:hypothetical protein
MGLNDWSNFIVPLTFLAIWALTSLFNREAKPLPNRPGSRPVPPPGPRPGERVGGPAGRDPTTRRPVAQGFEPRRPAPGRDEDVLIIQAEPIRPTPPKTGAGASARRVARAKLPPETAPKRIEPATSRPLVTGLGLPPQQITKPLVVGPLAAPPSSLTATPVATKAAPATKPPTTPSEPLLARAVRSPERLREAIVLSEILQPPLVLRRGRRM